ncbi:proteasome subunit beta type-3-like [Scaptodrosophila lebanonensis]|uniref:Proteasome subunit beta type-3 n=1 Tax=Drosophila lebanonensis TaxID=7225 RepID=A0A6J2UCG0_DROLE|nr:proteasome subunit beta type-3-like [Scaptodrosophila lebanonensis]
MSHLGQNGGCVLAMCGKDCVSIATDHRFGIRAETISTDFKKVFQMNPQVLLGMTGLQANIITVRDHMIFRKNMYELGESRDIAPKPFTAILSNFLYEHRFGPYYVEPIVAGLDPITSEPYVCRLDHYGCCNKCDDFAVSGTCFEQLYGICESLWSPNMDQNELFNVTAHAIVSACNRDAMSGFGATIYVMDKDKLVERTLKMRMD